MNIRLAGLYAAAVLASAGAVSSPPVSTVDSPVQDRGPQIMQMQLAAPAVAGAGRGMSGAEASVLAKRFINGDTRTAPAPASTSSSWTPQ